MAKDVYVKFGESDRLSPVYSTPLPEIDGDSDDSEHHWWCELRSCEFEMENPHELLDGEPRSPDSASDEGGGSDSSQAAPEEKKPASWFKTVSLRKRVDWASTQLFLKCCEVAEAKDKKTKEEQEKGVIGQVTVHVCRPVGERKIPFVIVRYYGVRITHYKLHMSGPEAAEDITFEFDAVEYDYQRTDPYTGLETEGGLVHTGKLANHKDQEQKRQEQRQAARGTTSSTTTGSSSPATTPTPVTAAEGDGSGSLASTIDQRAQRNFRGLRVGTGRGLLRH